MKHLKSYTKLFEADNSIQNIKSDIIDIFTDLKDEIPTLLVSIQDVFVKPSASSITGSHTNDFKLNSYQLKFLDKMKSRQADVNIKDCCLRLIIKSYRNATINYELSYFKDTLYRLKDYLELEGYYISYTLRNDSNNINLYDILKKEDDDDYTFTSLKIYISKY